MAGDYGSKQEVTTSVMGGIADIGAEVDPQLIASVGSWQLWKVYEDGRVLYSMYRW
jgi:hypothetical protein